MPTIEGGVPPDFLIFLEGIPRRRLSRAWKPGKSKTRFRRSYDHGSIGQDPVNYRNKKVGGGKTSRMVAGKRQNSYLKDLNKWQVGFQCGQHTTRDYLHFFSLNPISVIPVWSRWAFLTVWKHESVVWGSFMPITACPPSTTIPRLTKPTGCDMLLTSSRGMRHEGEGTRQDTFKDGVWQVSVQLAGIFLLPPGNDPRDATRSARVLFVKPVTLLVVTCANTRNAPKTQLYHPNKHRGQVNV